ncbi:MAG TPA: hypothetical protein VNB06_19395 [Thermoanaerobaculia bacterium]|nr:hypothetical protein [Thermoanaerobaculia bacterium]
MPPAAVHANRTRLPWYAAGVAIALLSVASALPAYEPDHYGWTYYLALQLGFTERQAYQLASGAYALDWDPDTEPMGTSWDKAQVAAGYPPEQVQAKWLMFHAFTETLYVDLGQDEIEAAKQLHEDRLWGLAVREGNPGPYLHFVQDRFAHHGWENVRGHAFAGHLPDTLADDPDRSRRMTEATLQALLRFKQLLCSGSPLGPPCTSKKAPDRGRIDEVLKLLFDANPVPPGVPRSELIRTPAARARSDARGSDGRREDGARVAERGFVLVGVPRRG